MTFGTIMFKIKYEDKARLCYMDTDSFIVNIKTKDFYKDISQDVNKRFDTSNYTFYNIENKLDKKINNNNTNDDFIKNIRDLFSILDYEPVLIKSGFEGNYLEYMSNGNNS